MQGIQERVVQAPLCHGKYEASNLPSETYGKVRSHLFCYATATGPGTCTGTVAGTVVQGLALVLVGTDAGTCWDAGTGTGTGCATVVLCHFLQRAFKGVIN